MPSDAAIEGSLSAIGSPVRRVDLFGTRLLNWRRGWRTVRPWRSVDTRNFADEKHSPHRATENGLATFGHPKLYLVTLLDDQPAGRAEDHQRRRQRMECLRPNQVRRVAVAVVKRYALAIQANPSA